MPRPKKNAPAAAPQEVATVGKSLLARFRFHSSANLENIAVLYGVSHNKDHARKIANYMAKRGYCKVTQKPYGTVVTLAPQWISWEHAYRAWCNEWGLEVAA